MDIESYNKLKELTHREPHEYMKMKGYNIDSINMERFKFDTLTEHIDSDREKILREMKKLDNDISVVGNKDTKDFMIYDNEKIQELFEDFHSMHAQNEEAESIILDSLFYESDEEMMRKLETELKINGTLKSSHKKPKSSYTKKRKKYKKKKKK